MRYEASSGWLRQCQTALHCSTEQLSPSIEDARNFTAQLIGTIGFGQNIAMQDPGFGFEPMHALAPGRLKNLQLGAMLLDHVSEHNSIESGHRDIGKYQCN